MTSFYVLRADLKPAIPKVVHFPIWVYFDGSEDYYSLQDYPLTMAVHPDIVHFGNIDEAETVRACLSDGLTWEICEVNVTVDCVKSTFDPIGSMRCKTCGKPKNNHLYRHPFVGVI